MELSYLMKTIRYNEVKALVELVQIRQKSDVRILAEFSNKDVRLEISDCLPFGATRNHLEKKNQQKFIKKSVKIQQIH